MSCFESFATDTFQEANLATSLYKKGPNIDFYAFYTYLKTAPRIFKGKDAFEAMTFRGKGINISLSENKSEIVAVIENQKIVFAHLEKPADQLPDGLHSFIINDGIKLRLDHASLGKPYRIKVPACLPGLPCLPHSVKVTPHRYKISIIAADGQAFCLTRGFNRTKETHLEVDDSYSLGNCN